MNPMSNDVDLLARNWSAIMLHALCAMVFGLFSVFVATRSLGALVVAFGGYALVAGEFSIYAAVQGRHDDEAPRWTYLWKGLSSTCAGLVTLLAPGMTMLVLVHIVAAWAAVGGLLDVAAGVGLRREIRGEWLLALCGIASVAFGTSLIAFPTAVAGALVLWLGLYVLVEGALLAAFAMRMRSWESGALILPPPVRSAAPIDPTYGASAVSADRDSPSGARRST
jgi:uncharacterized membrane protein HdeD (DUF308 family)